MIRLIARRVAIIVMSATFVACIPGRSVMPTSSVPLHQQEAP